MDMLSLRPGQRVLEVGCGLGVDAVAMAARGPAVVGTDASEAMVQRAWSSLAQQHNDTSVHVSFRQVREQDLLGALGEGSFDSVYSQRVLEHVFNMRDTIGRLARVVRPGGRVVVAEPDWGSYVIDHPNREMTRTLQRIFQRQVPHPWAGRKLRRLFREAGLTKLALRAVPVVFTDPARSGLLGAIENFAQQGVLEAADVAAYTDVISALRGESAFTSGMTMWVVRGFRPKGRLEPLQPIEDMPDAMAKPETGGAARAEEEQAKVDGAASPVPAKRDDAGQTDHDVKDPGAPRLSPPQPEQQPSQQLEPQQQQQQQQQQESVDLPLHDAATTMRLLRGSATTRAELPHRPVVVPNVATADDPDGVMQFVPVPRGGDHVREGLVHLPTGVM